MSERPQISPENWPWRQIPWQIFRRREDLKDLYDTKGLYFALDEKCRLVYTDDKDRYSIEIERLTTWLQTPAEKRGVLDIADEIIIPVWYKMQKEMQTYKNLRLIQKKLYPYDFAQMWCNLPTSERTVENLLDSMQLGLKGRFLADIWLSVGTPLIIKHSLLARYLVDGLATEENLNELHRIGALKQEDLDFIHRLAERSIRARMANVVEASRNQPKSPTRNSDNEMEH